MGHEQPLQPHTPAIAFSRVYDWTIGAVLLISGLLAGIGGATLNATIARSEVASLVRDADVPLDGLTDAELTDSLVVLGDWVGIGLVVTGGLMVIVAVAVVVTHGRARRNNRSTPRWVLAMMGAVVGTILGFVPFSPAIGGGAAAYFDPDQHRGGTGTGTIAGLFAAIPLLVVATFGAIGLFVDLSVDVAEPGAMVLGLGVLLWGIYLVGASAVGGLVGGRLRDT